MIVCVCRRVSDHQIRRAAAEGAVSLECLQFELGVATQCGRCADCASRVLCDARASSVAANGPIAHLQRSEQMG
jgi:bacterioferritin-associated ferredoxin